MTETQIHDTPCGHPRGCLVQDAEGTPRCAWCEEVTRLREELERAAVREAALVEVANTLVQRLAAVNLEKPNAIALGNALAYGPEVTALQDALENIAQPTSALLERLEQAEAEIERLRMILEQGGAAYLPCQHCGKDVATPTLESVELCFECWERLRELIPDAGMLHRLTYAAEKFWEGAGKQAQKDIAAGYALVEKLREETNIDRE